MIFRYNLVLKRNNDTQEFELPNLKSSNLLLKSFDIKTDQKAIDVKLSGKEAIVSYGESVFYQTNHFSLSEKMSRIIDADKLVFSVKNTSKEITNVEVTFNYEEDHGDIIYNQFYINLNAEGLATIVKDIINSGKYVTKIVWISPKKLTSIELTPRFVSEPEWLGTYKELANAQNQIIMDLTKDPYDPDFINQLRHYTLSVPEDLEKIGIIVYGFNH